MTVATLPLTVELQPDETRACAGTAFPIVVRLSLADDYHRSVRLRNIQFKDQAVHLDTDLIQRNVEIRPGETYRCTVQMTVPTQMDVDLSQLCVELSDYGEFIYAPPGKLSILPSLDEIAIHAAPICPYGDVHKIQLTFLHQGQTIFESLRINLQPNEAVYAGKDPITFSRFGPRDSETIIVAVKGDLRVYMTAVVGEDRAGIRREHAVVLPKMMEEKCETFHFLEPRRLSKDEIIVRTTTGQNERIEAIRSAHPLTGNDRYEVIIRPPHDRAVEKIVLHDIPEHVHVRKSSSDKQNNDWRFEIDVSYRGLFRKSERLNYTVSARGETLTGEIHVTLHPPWYKRWLVAATLGAAVTIQGFAALVTRLLNPDYPVSTLFANFDWSRDYPLIFLPIIPLSWVLLTMGDRLWYEWRT